MSDDIEALAAWAEGEVPACDNPADYTEQDRKMLTIAAALRRLRAERDAIAEAAMRLTTAGEKIKAAAEKERARALAAEAERDALRQALRDIANYAPGRESTPKMIVQFARAALAKGGTL